MIQNPIYVPKGRGKKLFIVGEFEKGEFDVMYGFADGMFRIGDEMWDDCLIGHIRDTGPRGEAQPPRP